MGIYTQSSPTSKYYLAYVLKAYFNLKTSNVNIVQVIVNLWERQPNTILIFSLCVCVCVLECSHMSYLFQNNLGGCE